MHKRDFLTTAQLQAAELVARGKTEAQIAAALDVSRACVTKWKDNPEFQLAIQDALDNFKSTIKQVTSNAILADIEDSRKRIVRARTLIYDSATDLMEKLQRRISQFTDEEMELLKPQQVAQALKMTADTLTVAIAIDTTLLGVDRVIKDIEGIKKAGSIQEDIID